MKTVLAALAFLSTAVVSPLVGQGDDQSARKTLAGLKRVVVATEIVDNNNETQRDGLLPGQLQTDIELKLRLAGITVGNAERARINEEEAGLQVHLLALKDTSGVYAIALSLEIYQGVRLYRNPSIIESARTWSARAEVGTVGSQNLASFVREGLRDMTDQFINAYLAANPKRSGG